jgi:hypothetical protein
MFKISILEFGHLFNHSNFEYLKEECKKNNIDLDTNLHKYMFYKDRFMCRSLLEDKDVLFINNFDVLVGDPKNWRLIERLKEEFPNKIMIGFLQELPHYKGVLDNKKHILDYSIGMAHEQRMPELKNYFYFPAPMPLKSIYHISDSNRILKRIFLSGAFRLARAQLYYRLMSRPDLDAILFYSNNRRYNRDYDGSDSLYPINFKEKFGERVISSGDNTSSDYVKQLSLSQMAINYSRQVTSTEGFHMDIDHNMNKVKEKKDFEFISTRVRECAMTKTLCLSNYDKIYEMSGLEEGVSMITYSCYEDLLDKCKSFATDPERCKKIGNNLFNHYKENYTDFHLIQKIKKIVL